MFANAIAEMFLSPGLKSYTTNKSRVAGGARNSLA